MFLLLTYLRNSVVYSESFSGLSSFWTFFFNYKLFVNFSTYIVWFSNFYLLLLSVLSLSVCCFKIMVADVVVRGTSLASVQHL